MSVGDEARDEVAGAVRRRKSRNEIDVDWSDLSPAVQSRLKSIAESYAEDGDYPYDAANQAARRLTREGTL